MMRDHFKATSGLIAVSIYLALAGTVLYYFNYRSSIKPVHYVEKNSNAIAVSLAGAKQPTSKKEGKKKKKSKKPKANKVRNITSKTAAPKRSRKAKKPAKKIKTSSLFSSVKSPKKPTKKTQDKKTPKKEKSASQKISESLKKPNNSDKGKENRYFAQIEQKLRGWPAQVNYAGEQISVHLRVYSDGSFEFRVKQLSANSEFNEALIAYLKQLQSIGLGRHSHNKPYEIDVEFEARE